MNDTLFDIPRSDPDPLIKAQAELVEAEAALRDEEEDGEGCYVTLGKLQRQLTRAKDTVFRLEMNKLKRILP